MNKSLALASFSIPVAKRMYSDPVYCFSNGSYLLFHTRARCRFSKLSPKTFYDMDPYTLSLLKMGHTRSLFLY